MESVQMPIIVSPGVWFLPLTIPKFVSGNSYLIVDKVITLIDTGHPSAVKQGVLERQLKRIGYSLESIDQIIYTHHHIDHSGGGAVLSQSYDMKHLANSNVSELLPDVDKLYDYGRYQPREVVRHYPIFEDFVNPEKTGEYYLGGYQHVEGFKGDIQGLKDGDVIDLGSRRLHVVLTQGHSISDLVLIDKENGVLFSGDFLIKGGVTFMFNDNANVKVYLQKLEKLTNVAPEIKLILPGHGEPIPSDLPSIADEMRREISKRSERIAGYLKEHGQSSAVEIFKNFYPNQLNHARYPGIFAILLTFIIYLQECGRIIEVEGEQGTFKLA